MKKILLFSPDFYPVIGGAEIFATKISEYFSQNQDFNVTVLTRYPTSSSRKLNKLEETKITRILGNISIIRSPYLEIKNFRVLTSIPLLILISNFLNLKNRYDIIHFVGFFPSAILYKFLFKFSNQRFIYTEQGMIIDVIRDGKNIYDASPFFLKNIYKFFFDNVDVVVAVSNNVKEKLLSYTKNNINIIPNGINSICVPKLRKSIDNEIFTILSSSRLVEKNNMFYLVQEFHRLLKKKNLNVKVMLKIYGDGEDRCKIEKYINENSLSSNITLHGTINHHDMLEAYKEAKLFIRPSVTEGFGISFIEALGSGIPVIGSKLVEKLGTYDQSCGSSVENFAPYELVNWIEKYLFDTNFYNQKSANAIEFSKSFLWTFIFKEYYELYRN